MNYETDYIYDAFDNLLTVDQKGGSTDSSQWRTRTFAYDSLSRLTSATNSESATISYAYDANGNITSKIWPAPNQTGSDTVTLSYCYDALNRLTSKSYTPSCSSPVATYLYDQSSFNGLTITNGIGRRIGMTDQAGSEAWSYDSMGRIATDRRTTNNVSYVFPYTYHLDGSLASDLSSTYTQGGAGRYTGAMVGNWFAAAFNVHYAPNGSLCFMQNAWGYWIHNYTFNNRFQPLAYGRPTTALCPLRVQTPCKPQV